MHSWFYGILSFLLAGVMAGLFVITLPQGILTFSPSTLASIFGVTITTDELKETYEDEDTPLTILLVPGHDKDYRGAIYQGLTEEELNRDLSQPLFSYLSSDPRFEVTTVRDMKTGQYTQEFLRYFRSERAEILDFMDERRKKVRTLMNEGTIERNVELNHNFAPSEVAVRLYGINKWANEHDIDLILHVHFNDDGARSWSAPGSYSGFAIYVPERQYPNAEASTDFARYLHSHLRQHNPPSDLPLEAQGVIEAQELIALGSNASQEGGALLIEYGYIYEDRFVYPDIRQVVTHELAYQTYRAIKGYFGDEPHVTYEHNTTILPSRFRDTSVKKGTRSAEVVALQAALLTEDIYPPRGKRLQECPLSGYFGRCTEQAVRLFQEKYYSDILAPHGMRQSTGIVGPSTKQKLEELYGEKI